MNVEFVSQKSHVGKETPLVSSYAHMKYGGPLRYEAFTNLDIAPINWADKLCKSFLLRHQRETEFPQQLLLVRLYSACRRILDDSLKKPICKATSYSAGKPTNAVDCEAKQLNSTSCNFWFMQLTYKCAWFINSCKKLKILATIKSNISSHVSFCSLSATTAWQTNRKKTNKVTEKQ